MAAATHTFALSSLLALCLLFCLLLRPSIARPVPAPRILALVPSAPLILSYHGGSLLTHSLQLHLLWYGSFAPSQQAIVSDFISSFQAQTTADAKPSVAGWWSTAHSYKDSSSAGVASHITLGQISSDSSYSIGKNLTKSDIDKLVESSLATGVFPSGLDAVILVLTGDDVLVEDFCMNSCGFHSSTSASSSVSKQPYIWVGNAAKQCPGFCAWPFAVPEFGPPTPPLVSPNGDVGMDGMVINIATLLAGTATNPFNTGYFQGDATDPLEAVTACAGIFGKNSYPGYAGDLLEDKASKASYNALGVNNRMFLLPAMWSPSTLECETLV